MRRLMALLLAVVLILTGCSGISAKSLPKDSKKQMDKINTANAASAVLFFNKNKKSESLEIGNTEENEIDSSQEETKIKHQEMNFDGLDDPELLQYVEDSVYAGLEDQFDTEDYVIENVEAIYISQEYLDDLAYNSELNIWFGYTSEELDRQFKGEKYLFTLGDNNETVVKPFEQYNDDTYEKVLKNVAIGTGVILVCVTISTVSLATNQQHIHAVFACSAKTSAKLAICCGVMSGVTAAATTVLETGDMNEALKVGALEGSEGFKWGAIVGAAEGAAEGIAKTKRSLSQMEKDVNKARDTADLVAEPTKWEQAEVRALQKYGGRDHVAFLQGMEVPLETFGATKPDIIRTMDNGMEAIEVKYYNLESPGIRTMLYKILKREVNNRISNLPSNSTQRIVLDVTDRGYSEELVDEVVQNITENLMDVYPNIPIDVTGK